MYISLDPRKINGLWDKLKNSVIESEFSYLIEDSKKNSAVDVLKLNANQADQLLDRMMKANYVRIGANKMLPIPPHFAIKLDSKSRGQVVELLAMDNKENTIRNTIELITQFSFFELKEMIELFIPYYIENIGDSEFNITCLKNNEGIIIRRK